MAEPRTSGEGRGVGELLCGLQAKQSAKKKSNRGFLWSREIRRRLAAEDGGRLGAKLEADPVGGLERQGLRGLHSEAVREATGGRDGVEGEAEEEGVGGDGEQVRGELGGVEDKRKRGFKNRKQRGIFLLHFSFSKKKFCKI